MPLNDPVPSKNIQEVLSRNLEDFDKIVNSEDLEVTLRTGEQRPTTKALQINNEEATQAKTDAESARDDAQQAASNAEGFRDDTQQLVNSLDISVEPTADSVVRRTDGGQVKAADGVDNDDVATVKQLNAAASNAADAARKAESIAMSALVFSNLFQEQ